MLPTAPALSHGVTKSVKKGRRLSAETRREQILQTAGSLFVERGFEGVSMADIAAALGTSRPTVYSYFPSTEVILEELFQQKLERLPERLAPYLQGQDVSQNVTDFRQIFQAIMQEKELLLLLNSGGGPLFRKQRSAFLEAITTRLHLRELSEQKCAALGRPPQPLLLPIVLNLLSSMAYAQVTENPGSTTTDPTTDDTLGQVLEQFILGGMAQAT